MSNIGRVRYRKVSYRAEGGGGGNVSWDLNIMSTIEKGPL